MLFAFSGRATTNFLVLVVVMHFILFIDRVNLAAAASVMQQDLGLSNIALGRRRKPEFRARTRVGQRLPSRFRRLTVIDGGRA